MTKISNQYSLTNILTADLANSRLGINNVSPAYSLDVYSTSASAARISITGTINFVTSQFVNTSGTMYVGIDDSAGANFTGVAYGRFIYSSGAYPFIFNINGSERMRITSAGNVGIGTTSPDKLLTLYSSVGSLDTGAVLRLIGNTAQDLVDISVADTKTRIYHQENSGDATAGYGIIQLRTNASANTSFPTRGGFQFTVGSTDAMFVSNIGTVGIGITPDASKLSVQASLNEWSSIMYGNTTSSQSYGLLIRGGTNSNDIAFKVQNATATSTYFNVRGDGNVGIGTTSISSATNQIVTEIYATSYATLRLSAAGTVKAELTANNQSNWLFIGTTTNHPVAFGTNETERMRITSGGNVGIGTTAPQVLVSSGLGIEISSAAGSSLVLSRSGNPTVDYGGISYDGNARIHSNGFIGFSLSGVRQITINNNGSMVVGSTTVNTSVALQAYSSGTTSATYPLSARNSASTDNFYIRSDGFGYLQAASWSYGSDRRIKENINYIETGLDKVLALKPATFDYIDGVKNNIGWIAQDVQEVIPEAVGVLSETNNQLTLKSEFIIPYLVKAVQQQQVQIEELKTLLKAK